MLLLGTGTFTKSTRRLKKRFLSLREVALVSDNGKKRIAIRSKPMKKRRWSNTEILQAIRNPSPDGYEVKIKAPEMTFIGAKEQPDFAQVYITMYPDEHVVELKSLKKYFFDFRNRLLSYERLINVVYADMMQVYKPKRLRLVMVFNPRGGISSKLTIDSDWKIRGGEENFNDWTGQSEEW